MNTFLKFTQLNMLYVADNKKAGVGPAGPGAAVPGMGSAGMQDPIGALQNLTKTGLQQPPMSSHQPGIIIAKGRFSAEWGQVRTQFYLISMQSLTEKCAPQHFLSKKLLEYVKVLNIKFCENFISDRFPIDNRSKGSDNVKIVTMKICP